jgi:hypothetical protein
MQQKDDTELPKVRVAVEADLPQLIQMGIDLHRENAAMPLSPKRVEEAVWRAILQQKAMIGVIGNGTLEAMIYLTIGQFWYTDDLHVEELYAYVKPEYRKSRNAKALVEFAKSSALKMNIPLLIGIISNSQTEAKIRLYERQLGPRAGAYFLFNGHTGSK